MFLNFLLKSFENQSSSKRLKNYCSIFLLHFRLLLLWNILKLDPLAAAFRGASCERERKKAVGLELGDKFKRGVPGHQANITSIHVQCPYVASKPYSSQSKYWLFQTKTNGTPCSNMHRVKRVWCTGMYFQPCEQVCAYLCTVRDFLSWQVWQASRRPRHNVGESDSKVE